MAGSASTVAVEAVLRAEGAAEERIRRARHDAAAIVAAARAREEAIKRRADTRISRVHIAYMARIDEEIARLETQLTPASDAADAAEAAALARVIDRLAGELTGRSDESVS
jgi:hypothetical protein